MAVPVSGKVLIDTNVFVDYLRVGFHADWVFGRVGDTIRFLSSVVLMELRLGADTLRRKKAVDRIKAAFPHGRLIAPAPQVFDHTGQLFRILYDGGSHSPYGPSYRNLDIARDQPRGKSATRPERPNVVNQAPTT